jgi:phosphatidate cytidylyltransferase
MGEWIALTIVIAIMAPMGDLVESMFKRNLDVKDFGTIVAGHGGVLDRFDGFFFVLPAVYYLMLVTSPWA